jgi:aminoethylphosphonate catabolism LysR family transcriptional regulator
MNITQLRAFHLVAGEGSFSKAARLSGISQPTLSVQVRQLEEAHGARLFERQRRGVRLTALGQSLYDVTERLFAVEEEARALLTGAQAPSRGHLRVSADNAFHVMPVLAELRSRNPGLSFALRIDNSAAVLRHLTDYEADVAVMAKSVSDPRLRAFRFRSDRLVLFVPRDHAWAGRRAVPRSALAGEALVLRERGSITREVFEASLAEAQVFPARLTEVETREGVREAVAAGFGIGVVFASEFGTDARFRMVEIGDAKLEVAEHVVCLAERRRLPLVRAFLDIASTMAA